MPASRTYLIWAAKTISVRYNLQTKKANINSPRSGSLVSLDVIHTKSTCSSVRFAAFASSCFPASFWGREKGTTPLLMKWK